MLLLVCQWPALSGYYFFSLEILPFRPVTKLSPDRVMAGALPWTVDDVSRGIHGAQHPRFPGMTGRHDEGVVGHLWLQPEACFPPGEDTVYL